MSSKSNIILFITHDQGQFLGCYDSIQTPNSLSTPNLDQIANNGVKFTNYFCTAPQCSPSRGSIMTSKYPHQNGLMGLVNRGWTLPLENKTLPSYLKKNQYSTYLIGLQHESLRPSELGYDSMTERFSSKKGVEIDFLYNCRVIEEECLNFFKDHKNCKSPFFLNIGLGEVHRPFKIWGEPVEPEIVKIPPFLPNNDIFRKELAEYYGAINRVDETIGKILKMLEENGLKRNTLFIFTTDHGSPFPRAKCTLYDPGIKTILIMYQDDSNLFNGGKVIDTLLSNIDLLPTLLELVGGEIPEDIEGKSFLPILRGEKKEIRNEIFIEKTYHELYDPIRGIRTERYKYIRNFIKSNTLYQMPSPILMAPSGKYMKDKYNKPRADEELYDLKTDPNEQINLIKMPEYEGIADNLRKRLDLWLKNTKDPILLGKVNPQPQVKYKYETP
ncbi:MAG: sulfatase [Candidatus Heimdallarchaeota archaeon]